MFFLLIIYDFYFYFYMNEPSCRGVLLIVKMKIQKSRGKFLEVLDCKKNLSIFYHTFIHSTIKFENIRKHCKLSAIHPKSLKCSVNKII